MGYYARGVAELWAKTRLADRKLEKIEKFYQVLES